MARAGALAYVFTVLVVAASPGPCAAKALFRVIETDDLRLI